MKKRRFLALLLATAAVLTVLLCSGCHAATESASLTIADASGKGTIASDVIICLDPSQGNTPYVKDVQKLADGLAARVNQLTQTKDIYHVEYAGKTSQPAFDGGYYGDIIRLTYSFDDINDYNLKTMRLFNSVPASARNRVSERMGNEYYYASWVLSDNGNGTYKATFSQNAYAFTAMNLWAYDYLVHYDIAGAWDNTGNDYAVQYSPMNDSDTVTMISSKKTTVTLSIGGKSTTLNAYNGSTANTLTATGTVSGTPVSARTDLDDKTIITNIPMDDPSSDVPSDHTIPEGFKAKQEFTLDLPTDRTIKVACVGDSITQGADNWSYPAYPAYLQDILGPSYDVRNFGVSGSTLMSSDNIGNAYTKTDKYKESIDFEPDVVIIMLGTNDSASYAYKRFDKYFDSDYEALVDAYKSLDSHPYVIASTSPYVARSEGDTALLVNDVIVDHQRELFANMDSIDGVVDIYAFSEERYYLYIDGVHYSPMGYYTLAMEFTNRIFGTTMNTITIKTVPGARVEMTRRTTGANSYIYNAVADKDGIALCYGINGTHDILIRAEDYCNFSTTTQITGDATLNLPLTPGQHNVALYRPIVATSELDETSLATNANDRDYNSHWSPVDYLDRASASKLVIDLGETKRINGMCATWDLAFASGYKLQVSNDNKTWKDACVVTDGKGSPTDEHFFSEVSGRYVRFVLTKRGSGMGFNVLLFGLQIYSPDERTLSDLEKGMYVTYSEAEETVTGFKGETALSLLGDVTAVSSKGAALAADDLVGTGCVITKGGIDYTAVVMGDVNGDGKIGTADFLMVRDAYLEKLDVSGYYDIAARVSGKSQISTADFLMIRDHFLSKTNIYTA